MLEKIRTSRRRFSCYLAMLLSATLVVLTVPFNTSLASADPGGTQDQPSATSLAQTTDKPFSYLDPDINSPAAIANQFYGRATSQALSMALTTPAGGIKGSVINGGSYSDSRGFAYDGVYSSTGYGLPSEVRTNDIRATSGGSLGSISGNILGVGPKVDLMPTAMASTSITDPQGSSNNQKVSFDVIAKFLKVTLADSTASTEWANAIGDETVTPEQKMQLLSSLIDKGASVDIVNDPAIVGDLLKKVAQYSLPIVKDSIRTLFVEKVVQLLKSTPGLGFILKHVPLDKIVDSIWDAVWPVIEKGIYSMIDAAATGAKVGNTVIDVTPMISFQGAAHENKVSLSEPAEGTKGRGITASSSGQLTKISLLNGWLAEIDFLQGDRTSTVSASVDGVSEGSTSSNMDSQGLVTLRVAPKLFDFLTNNIDFIADSLLAPVKTILDKTIGNIPFFGKPAVAAIMKTLRASFDGAEKIIQDLRDKLSFQIGTHISFDLDEYVRTNADNMGILGKFIAALTGPIALTFKAPGEVEASHTLTTASISQKGAILSLGLKPIAGINLGKFDFVVNDLHASVKAPEGGITARAIPFSKAKVEYLSSTGDALGDAEDVQVQRGDTVKLYAKEFDGFKLAESNKNIKKDEKGQYQELKFADTPQDVKFIYAAAKPGPVTVKYLEQGTSKQLAEPTTLGADLEIGETVDINPATINNYSVKNGDALPKQVKLTKDAQEFTFYYTKNADPTPNPSPSPTPKPSPSPTPNPSPSPTPNPSPTLTTEPTNPAPEPTNPAPEPTNPAPEPTNPAPEPNRTAAVPTRLPNTGSDQGMLGGFAVASLLAIAGSASLARNRRRDA